MNVLAELVAKITADATELKKGLAETEKGVQQTGEVIEKETKSWQQQFKTVGASFTKVGIGMMAVGTALVGSLVAITLKTAKAGDEIAKMSQKTGLTIQTLSKLKYAAELSGTSLEGMQTAIRTMSSVMYDARAGLETANRTFRDLNINLEELAGLSPDQQFMKIALAVAAVEDPMLKAALAQDIFGRSGLELLPMLSEGEAGLKGMMEEAEKLGVVFDEKAAAAAEKFNDAITTLKTSLQGVGLEIAKTLMPILTNLAEKALIIVGRIKDWIELHPELAKNLLALGVILVGAGGLLIALGQISKAIMAINAALIIMHSLSGVGILKVVAGLAVAAGLIVAMNKLLETPKTATTPAIPGMQYGGIVPGAIGQPVPIIAHGGEEFLGVGNTLSAGGNTVNVNVGYLMGDETSLRKFTRMIKQILGEDDRRTAFGQVNQGYFYGRSSI